MGWNLIFDILQNISLIIASIVAIYGINSWRREAKWKRKYELAEEVLANMYEAQQAIRNIRSPFGYQNEGNSRKVEENETPEQTKAYNQAYVVSERYKNNNVSLQKIHALKFRFIALYGKEHEQHFNKFHQTINQIFSSADQIAQVNLGFYDFDKDLRRSTIKDNNEILYLKITDLENDLVDKGIQNAIDEIEEACKKIIGKIK